MPISSFFEQIKWSDINYKGFRILGNYTKKIILPSLLFYLITSSLLV